MRDVIVRWKKVVVVDVDDAVDAQAFRQEVLRWVVEGETGWIDCADNQITTQMTLNLVLRNVSQIVCRILNGPPLRNDKRE